ncbi:MAG: right-handed parallel beta-helix repeat-containing protein [Sedimentisphaerales bacterium]|nr:right-handed parallel beta-helix repeat-containing protein [Sedimentisphaerales bacterium]
MKRLKSCYLILVLLVCVIINATGKAAAYQLIVDDISLQNLSTDTASKLNDNLLSVCRSKYVSLNPLIMEEMNLSAGDNIILNLFPDASYIAQIEKVSVSNNTATINGSIQSHSYSEFFISKTGNQIFISVNIPDEGKQFIIRSDTGAGGYLLMEIDSSKIQYKDGPAVLSDMNINLDEMLLANNQFATDSDGPVSIDIMIVYTQAAYEDSGLYYGGIDNYIAVLMNEANAAFEQSQIYVKLNLVHSAMVDYVENKIAYKYDPVLGDITQGSLYAALRHLGEEDSYMEEVRHWRDMYGADLVTLLVSNRVLLNNNYIAGLANQLTNASGNSNDAFSVIVTRFSNYTFIHELGHNMGCGHSRYQSDYNYGGLFEYSYGWRWANLCSIMAYPESDYTRIGLFSNPNIFDDYGFPAGDPYEADNARTICQTMYAIADYRDHVDINDVNVPEYEPITIYVNKNAPSGGNGLSWATAYNYLRDALLAAVDGDEIWVAAGTYKSTDGINDPNNRNKSFILKEGVYVYGGFSGSETKRDQRNLIKNKTVLSGDIGIHGKNKDNSLRIILGAGDSVLDGFTITGSFGDDTFYSMSGKGGGIYFDDVNDITIANCIFDDNYSITGSGIYINKCSLVDINNCTFKNNMAEHRGIVIAYNSDIAITDCQFTANHADYSGGGLELHKCNATITNCLVVNNSAQYGAGADIWSSDVSIANCTFANNSATIEGGAMESYGNTKVINSIFWNNTGGEIAGNAKVNYSNIQGGWPGSGANNINIDPLFADVSEGNYHLKSTAGRWNPNSKSWQKDKVTSPCIDAGDLNTNIGDELWPHGKRINMGAYGGTSQASMSLSNVGDARDMNNDDSITWDDVLLLIDKWNSNDVPLKEDFNLDGVVDINDLAFYENWSTDFSNAAPVFDSIEDQYINVGNELSFIVSATDTDSDELVFMSLGLPEGAEFTNQTFIWTPEQAGIFLVTFIVSDYKSLDYVTVKIIVE